MQKFRRLLYVFYFMFHLGMILGILYLKKIFNLYANEVQMVLYVAVAGLFLFVLKLIADVIIDRSNQNSIKTLEGEKNEAKAKMFDMQKQTDQIASTMTNTDTTKKDSTEQSDNIENAN